MLLEVEMNILKVQNDILIEMMAEEERKKEVEKKRRKERECWTRLWVSRRETLGEYRSILKQLKILKVSADTFVWTTPCSLKF